MPKFTHLHVHSHYSLLDGLAKIDELLNRAKELEMDSLALTDHGALYGAIEFFIKAKEKGIKPIIGCEMYVTPGDYHSRNNTAEDKTRYHLILLCRNEKGYKNLMKLITISHLEGFYYKPRINKELLKKYAEGLIGMSACIEGEIPATAANGDAEKAEKAALEYQSIFGPGNFYLEIQRHPRYPKQEIANQALIKISRRHNIPLVATNDIHYVHKDDAPIQDILLCIQTNRKVSDANRMNMLDFDLYLKSPAEMAESFSDIPEAIANTQKIVADCNLEIKLGETQLPHFKVPEGKTPESLLDELTLAGLKKRFGENVTREQKDRMEYELGVIKKTGLASYFLIVQDFINWAKNRGIIVGPGRGSAAGSFVSYLLNITNIDPIKYDLLFERFLNPERISMPDIDMDFADDRRDEVLEYVRKKYGDDHVAQIITFGTMAARAAIRDAGRALGIPYEFCDKTAKLIPMFATIPEALKEAKEFKDLYATDLGAKKLIDSARRLEGVVRHASMHACGVVITRQPVTEYTPLQRIIGKESGTVTQYSSSTKSSFIEKIGLLKMDFLGLKNLTIIQNTLRIVRKIYPSPLSDQPLANKDTAGSAQKRETSLDIDAIPPDDKKTYALLQKALTTGVFQLESSGMKRYLKQLKPTQFEDIIAMVSLYRPGPMEWIPDFIARKNGEREIRYLHPKLKPILEKTYGVAVYQEQVMQIAQQLAGFSLGEADVLRKAMGKKVFSLIQQEKIKFIEGCVNQGIGRNIGEQVFSFIEPFAGYGFNRSHAACYALIGYQTAYLKAHFPAPFMAALLTSDQNNIDRVAIEVSECSEMGIEVLPPNINESFEEFAVIPDLDGKIKRIRFGLNAIKNVGRPVAHTVVEERKRNGKFKNLTDFIERVETKDLNKKSLEALAKVGALEELGERNKIISSMENILAYSKNFQRQKVSNQASLFGETQIRSAEITLADSSPADKKQCLTWEKELLGLYISDHPVKDFKNYLEKIAIPIRNITSQMVGQSVTVGGVIAKIQKIYLKNQKTMLFVTLEDMTGRMEVLVFPKVLEATQSIWEEDKVILARGKVSDKDGNFKLLCDRAKIITAKDLEKFKQNASVSVGTDLASVQNQKFRADTRLPARQTMSAPAADLHNIPHSITLILPPDSQKETLKKLSAFFNQCQPGEMKVFLIIGGAKLEIPCRIKNTPGLREALKNIIAGGKIDMV